MAILEKKVLGVPVGKVSDIVFRGHGSDTVIASKPSSFMPGTDAVSVARRARFAMAVKFSHAVNYLSQLKHFWKLYGNEGTKFRTPFNKMVKNSYQTVTDTDITSTTSLVPEIGFEITASEFTLSDTGITLELSPIGNDKGIDLATEVSYQVAAVVFLKTPTGDSAVPYYFLHKMSASGALNLTNPLTATIPFDNIEGQYFNEYSGHKGLISLITLNSEGQPVRYSNTVQSA